MGSRHHPSPLKLSFAKVLLVSLVGVATARSPEGLQDAAWRASSAPPWNGRVFYPAGTLRAFLAPGLRGPPAGRAALTPSAAAQRFADVEVYRLAPRDRQQGRSRPARMEGFSNLSYYTTLALFVLAFPGLYSLVKRSVKSKVVRKTYEVAGPAAANGRATREVAGDIVAYFQANNYKISDATDTIVFEGEFQSLNGRAAFLTFCTFIGFAAFALVLTIFEQGVFGEGKGLGNFWYLSTLVSPLSGKYYLDNAERVEKVSVKIITEDDEMTSDIIVQGDDEEIERFQKTLDLREKGMVYVKGLLEV